MSGWKTESEMAMSVSRWLVDQGWTPYHEVCRRGGSPRADIVATKGRLVWVVECKMSLGLDVLAQAHAWVWQSHFVSVAVPFGKDSRGRRFAKTAARNFGIGMIETRPIEEPRWSRWRVQPPAFRRQADTGQLLRFLDEQQRVVVPGGKTDYHTPFRSTCKRVLEYLEKFGGSALAADTMRAVSHHYDNDVTARSSFVARAREGVVPGIDVTVGAKSRLYLTIRIQDAKTKEVAQ